MTMSPLGSTVAKKALDEAELSERITDRSFEELLVSAREINYKERNKRD